MRTATDGLLKLLAPALALEAHVELLDMGNQIVDSLDGVLSALIRSQQLLVESQDAVIARFDLASKLRVLGLEPRLAVCQCRHRALESLEVVGFERVELVLASAS